MCRWNLMVQRFIVLQLWKLHQLLVLVRAHNKWNSSSVTYVLVSHIVCMCLQFHLAANGQFLTHSYPRVDFMTWVYNKIGVVGIRRWILSSCQWVWEWQVLFPLSRTICDLTALALISFATRRLLIYLDLERLFIRITSLVHWIIRTMNKSGIFYYCLFSPKYCVFVLSFVSLV